VCSCDCVTGIALYCHGVGVCRKLCISTLILAFCPSALACSLFLYIRRPRNRRLYICQRNLVCSLIGESFHPSRSFQPGFHIKRYSLIMFTETSRLQIAALPYCLGSPFVFRRREEQSAISLLTKWREDTTDRSGSRYVFELNEAGFKQ